MAYCHCLVARATLTLRCVLCNLSPALPRSAVLPNLISFFFYYGSTQKARGVVLCVLKFLLCTDVKSGYWSYCNLPDGSKRPGSSPLVSFINMVFPLTELLLFLKYSNLAQLVVLSYGDYI